MGITVGLRRKARADTPLMLAGSPVLIDPVPDKIRRGRCPIFSHTPNSFPRRLIHSTGAYLSHFNAFIRHFFMMEGMQRRFPPGFNLKKQYFLLTR
jgi:hypothetical protein